MTLTFPQTAQYVPMERCGGFSTVFIDFDGTIADNDVTDVLLSNFAATKWLDLEDAWLKGTIGARECMARQIALMKVTPEDLDACLDTMEIDDAFADFIEMLEREHSRVAIVSDGLDYSIKHILNRFGLSRVTVFANQLVYQGGKDWQLQFPYKNNACPAGHCKCRRFDGTSLGSTLYIGDGTSDFCPAQKADLVLAKAKLADFCAANQINHIKVANFTEIMKIWPDLEYQNQVLEKVAS